MGPLGFESVLSDYRFRILAVEDSALYQHELRLALSPVCDLVILASAEEGEAWLNNHLDYLPDLVLLDVVLPGIDGIAFLERIRAHAAYHNLPVIIMTELSEIDQKRRAFQLDVVDFITKPYHAEEVQLRIKAHTHAAMARKWLTVQNRLLEERVQAQVAEITHTRDAIIICMANLAETRDNETGKHIQRTQFYVKTLIEAAIANPALSQELEGMDLDLIARSAPLHDIGKVGIPDAILQKPGPLDATERKTMQRHTDIGRDVLIQAERISEATALFRHARRIAFCHHEKWDGSGYPQGLAGRTIPVEARIMALADVFDALITRRVYKAAYTVEKSIEIMTQEMAGHFDPALLKVFLLKIDPMVGFALANPEPLTGGA